MWSIVLNSLGIIGNIAFSIGCLPPAYRVIKEGKNTQLPIDFAWILWVACASFYTYLNGTYGWNWLTGPLGIIETLSYTAILYLSYFPRSN